MPRLKKPQTARLDLEISSESQRLFAAIQKSLGLKSRAETFEAIVFSISAKDVIHPSVLERIESKIDQTLETLDSLA